jgi:hypothetical protein
VHPRPVDDCKLLADRDSERASKTRGKVTTARDEALATVLAGIWKYTTAKHEVKTAGRHKNGGILTTSGRPVGSFPLRHVIAGWYPELIETSEVEGDVIALRWREMALEKALNARAVANVARPYRARARKHPGRENGVPLRG